MISKKDFKRISDWLWEIPKGFRPEMRVSARIYISEEMMEQTFRDRSLNQLINISSLPGIVRYSLAMPDMHEGYGFPIGGVAAMNMEDGVISPGGVGYDINCGMRVLKSEHTEEEVRPFIEQLAVEIQRQVPSGLGRGRKVKLDINSINKILEGGSRVLVKKGYGDEQDLENCESEGMLEQADASYVSDRAKNRGRNQVGTLGSGNHFMEVQKVDTIFDENIAKVFGLFKNQIVIMIHTGSRGLGHQIASDYIKVMMSAMQKYDIRLHLSAMACGANYAWANRQMIAHSIREAWKSTLGEKASPLVLLYDVAHNIAKIEEYEINGKKTKLCVHRKGATRAFPPNHSEIPERYKKVGQPVLIPGSMGTASYILVGTNEGEQSFYSTCHGAGRTMSRKQATRTISGQNVVKELKQKGITVKCWSSRGIAEEAPLAYKDIDSVVGVVHNAGLAKKVARLVPLAVIKGE
jgi:tRNA-splicing ligase RtcB